MPWRIVSGGMDRNTQIRHTETGELFPLEDVESITWNIHADGIATLTVTLRAVEIHAEVEEVTVERDEMVIP
jgi:hypothetical protein|tara:strand:- start:4043 stop:4258 length:216 start_codon:yes stop_codon:yes gene_type:complete